MTWGPLESIGTAFVPLLTAIGFGLKAAKDKGALEQKVKDLDKRLSDDVTRRLSDHDVVITAHTATLAQHEGSFKVIDTKLDYIKEAVQRRNGE